MMEHADFRRESSGAARLGMRSKMRGLRTDRIMEVPTTQLSALIWRSRDVAGKRVGISAGTALQRRCADTRKSFKSRTGGHSAKGPDFSRWFSLAATKERFPQAVVDTRSQHRKRQLGALGTAAIQISALHRISLGALFSQSPIAKHGIHQGWQPRAVCRAVEQSLALCVTLARTDSASRQSSLRSRAAQSSDLEWNVSYSAAARQEPDNREVTYLKKDDGLFHFTPKGQSGQRFFCGQPRASGRRANRLFPSTLSSGAGLGSIFQKSASLVVSGCVTFPRAASFGFGGIGDIDDTTAPEQIFSAENLGSAVDARETPTRRTSAPSKVSTQHMRASIFH